MRISDWSSDVCSSDLLRISPVIGFILVGLAVGPSGLGALVGQYPWLYHVTISNRAAIEPFAELGVILLLFSIGLELSFRRLWTMRTQVFGVGAAELIGGGTLIALDRKSTRLNSSH